MAAVGARVAAFNVRQVAVQTETQLIAQLWQRLGFPLALRRRMWSSIQSDQAEQAIGTAVGPVGFGFLVVVVGVVVIVVVVVIGTVRFCCAWCSAVV